MKYFLSLAIMLALITASKASEVDESQKSKRVTIVNDVPAAKGRPISLIIRATLYDKDGRPVANENPSVAFGDKRTLSQFSIRSGEHVGVMACVGGVGGIPVPPGFRERGDTKISCTLDKVWRNCSFSCRTNKI